MSVLIMIGDCRRRLRELADSSIHCCVTSPPYFGLRDYDVEDQMGLESSPDEFVAGMVEVLRDVRRVLRDDGTLWLNIGDSYSASAGQRKVTDRAGLKQQSNVASVGAPSRCAEGCKPKDLIGIPWMLAFALRADGWYLRQDIIWSKPNPMPESVRDRCTKAHEYLFLLSKSQRYHFDAEAIAESALTGFNGSEFHTGKTAEHQQGRASAKPQPAGVQHKQLAMGQQIGGNLGSNDPFEKRNKRDVWTVGSEPFDLEFCSACQRSYDRIEYRALKRRKIDEKPVVWCRCGESDKWLSHFATFPPALIVDCIRAGCPARCCAECGAPEVRQVERTPAVIAKSDRTHSKGRTRSSGTQTEPARSETTGFARSCSCEAPLVPGRVLDPFGGAGTTGMVANREHRQAILVELNSHYAEMTRQRLARDGGMLAKIEVSRPLDSGPGSAEQPSEPPRGSS